MLQYIGSLAFVSYSHYIDPRQAYVAQKTFMISVYTVSCKYSVFSYASSMVAALLCKNININF